MFHIALLIRPATKISRTDTGNANYSLYFDDVRSILADLCDKIEDLGVLTFSVGGFGQAEWPVDIRYDLVYFLEQIGPVLASIKKSLPVALSFPEQGIERTIHITPLNCSSQITCTSFGAWKPNLDIVEVSTPRLQECLYSIVKIFLDISTMYFPSLTNHHWFVEWKNQLMALMEPL